MADSFREAWRTNGETETVWLGESDQIVLLAPHGGDIEFNTEHTAAQTHKRLRKRGYDPTTWMYHSWGEDAFTRDHISTNDMTADDFTQLGSVTERQFDYAVSFHIQDEEYVAIGGQVADEVRVRIRGEIADRLPDEKDVRVDKRRMKYTGSADSNIVNWITTDGASGAQIEMTPKVSYNYWKRVATAVVEVYDDLLGDAASGET